MNIGLLYETYFLSNGIQNLLADRESILDWEKQVV
jgi:hypothetical protein